MESVHFRKKRFKYLLHYHQVDFSVLSLVPRGLKGAAQSLASRVIITVPGRESETT
jgi:hypothetical protein